MTIATDALIKGNQLIHEYVNSGKQGFRNEVVDTEMKKILSNFRADCHITKSLLVNENVIRIDVADYEFDDSELKSVDGLKIEHYHEGELDS